MSENSHPPIVSEDEWLKARKALLQKEKELTYMSDSLSAFRRRLPMVKVDKNYTFEGPKGKVTLLDLFEGRDQLIVYHFMFDPESPPAGKSGAPWEEGCPGCSHIADNIPHLAHLHARNTSFVMVSRAPLSKIEPFKKRMQWDLPWCSSYGTDFNYDFHVSMDAAKGSTEWNYEDVSQTMLNKEGSKKAELPGISVFLKVGNEIFHTYSAYARGLDHLVNTHNLLDLTPYGRQEEWEDSPSGWPQSSTHGWLKHHDKYDGEKKGSCCC